jgi:tetratricopeptide (TPR) repeat protein
LGSLGQAYIFLGDYAKAIEYLQQRLAIAREIKDRRGEGNALGSLGVAYQDLGDYTKAIEYSKQWLAIAWEVGDKNGEGLALNNLGLVFHKSGNLPEAEKILRTGIDVWEFQRGRLGIMIPTKCQFLRSKFALTTFYKKSSSPRIKLMML